MISVFYPQSNFISGVSQKVEQIREIPINHLKIYHISIMIEKLLIYSGAIITGCAYGVLISKIICRDF